MNDYERLPKCFGSAQSSSTTCYHCKHETDCHSSSYVKPEKKGATNMKYERPTKDNYYVDIALAVSKRSTCNKRHYGCVIVKDDRIVSTGYNGSPRGEINCCDNGECQRKDKQRGHGYEDCPAVHAEMNAIINGSKEELEGSTLYLACDTYQEPADYDNIDVHYSEGWSEDKFPVPCFMCSGLIKNAGISRVVNRNGDISI